MDRALTKLKSIAKFLKVSGKFNFQNYNISLFINFLKEDPEISVIINNLISKYPEIKQHAKDVFDNKDSMPRFDTFERWVAFCIFYIEEAGVNKGNKVIDSFIVQTGVPEDNEGLSLKLQFYNDCIEPILIYIELQIKHSLNAIRILHRYKILCEWYDRDKIVKQYKTEPDITKNHLSKFLFDQGFTYSFSETIVPSGRIDNFAVQIGITKSELSNLPDALVVEAKIVNNGDAKKQIQEVKNQISKRIGELNFKEGFCVVYNKSNKNINLENSDGNVQGFQFLLEAEKIIFFVIINVNEDFYSSKKNIEIMNINVK